MTAYQSWSVVFGEQPSAAKWNILGTNDSSFNDGTGISSLEIGSGHTSLKNDYKFSVYRNSALTSGSGAFVKITFDSKVFDTGSNFDATTNFRFTAPVAGFYQFNSRIGISNVNLKTAFYKNGSEYMRGVDDDTSGISGTASYKTAVGGALIQLSANDYVEVWGYTASSTSYTVGSLYAWFTGWLVSQT